MAAMKYYINEPVGLLDLFIFVVRMFFFSFPQPVVFCTYYPLFCLYEHPALHVLN